MLPRYAVHHRVVVGFCVLLIIVGGIGSYLTMGRLEDPEFSIKTALVVTIYPGASANEVAEKVTNVVERAAQQVRGVDIVRSVSKPNLSLVLVDLEPDFPSKQMPTTWQDLRNKMGAASVELPLGALPPIVNDDFAEVYGIIFALSGDGYSDAELRDRAKMLQKEFLEVDQVRRVELWGLPEEQIEVVISQAKMSELSIPPVAVFLALAGQNLTTSAGEMTIGGEKIRIAPTGMFQSLEEIENLTIPAELDFAKAAESLAAGTPAASILAQMAPRGDSGARPIRLGDLATVRRLPVEEPRHMARSDGHRAVAIALSPVPNGDVIRMGAEVRQRADELMRDFPAGFRLDTVTYQPDNVNISIHAFTKNLYEAVIIVMIVVMIAMGWRSGLLITSSLLIVMLGTICVLYPMGLVLQRVTLGAFIIALGILVDDAVVVGDLILVRMQRGMDRAEACIEGAHRAANQLLGATVVGALAFLPIWLSPDMTGEYAGGIFVVLAISLMISWFVAMLQTPVVYYLFVRAPKTDETTDPHAGPVFKLYRKLLVWTLHHKTVVLGTLGVALAVAIFGFTQIPQIFFPRATRTQFMVDYWLPEGGSIRAVADDMAGIEKYLLEQPGVTNVSSFLGGGPPRFYLPYEPELPNSSYGQIVVNVDSIETVNRLLEPTETWIHQHYPQAETRTQRFALGPTTPSEVEVRFSGPDEGVLRELAARAKEIFHHEPTAKFVRDDWRQKIPAWRPDFAQSKGTLSGVTRAQMLTALHWATLGIPAARFGDGENLLKIVVRGEPDDRHDLERLKSTPVWGLSPSSVPLDQVVLDHGIDWENGIVRRRNRFPTITVGADAAGVEWATLMKTVRQKIESIELPPEFFPNSPSPSPSSAEAPSTARGTLPAGYKIEWGGQYAKSQGAQNLMLGKLPIALVFMAVIVVALFNGLRQPLIILLTFPLAMIGITIGLMVMGKPFGFMALIGAMSLLGMMVRNGVVLMDQIDEEMAKGDDPYHAILDASVERMRPVTVAAMTVIVGMIPLLRDPLFDSMATAIMFGLIFATVLTLFVVPIFYMILFRVPLPKPKESETR